MDGEKLRHRLFLTTNEIDGAWNNAKDMQIARYAGSIVSQATYFLSWRIWQGSIRRLLKHQGERRHERR